MLSNTKTKIPENFQPEIIEYMVTIIPCNHSHPQNRSRGYQTRTLFVRAHLNPLLLTSHPAHAERGRDDSNPDSVLRSTIFGAHARHHSILSATL